MHKSLFTVILVLFVVTIAIGAKINDGNSSIRKSYTMYIQDFCTKSKYNISQERIKEIVDGILEASKEFDVPPNVILAMVQTESEFKNVIGSYGEVGVIQVKPSTAYFVIHDSIYNEKFGFYKNNQNWIGQRLLFDIKFNIKVGVAYLKLMLVTNKNNLTIALGWYNGGGAKNIIYPKKVYTALKMFG